MENFYLDSSVALLSPTCFIFFSPLFGVFMLFYGILGPRRFWGFNDIYGILFCVFFVEFSLPFYGILRPRVPIGVKKVFFAYLPFGPSD